MAEIKITRKTKKREQEWTLEDQLFMDLTDPDIDTEDALQNYIDDMEDDDDDEF